MIKDIIVFYRNPYSYFNVGENETMQEKASSFKKAFIICLCSTLIIGVLIVVIDEILKSNFNISIVKSLLDGRKEFRTVNSPFIASLEICLLAPFKEELTFRLPLTIKSKFLRFAVYIILLEYFFPEFLSLEIFSLWNHAIFLVILIIIITSEKVSDQDFPAIFKKESYNYLCWGLTIAFALVHINNFAPLNWSFIYLYPVYVLPQFVYAIVFSYIAIRYNSIVWPFLLHAAINSTSEIYKLLNDVL